MPTIFAIDGAELGYDFADFGAVSQSVAALQTALVALGKGVGDPVLKVLVIDGLIGPKTTAATNRAFTTHIGAYQAPAHYRTGNLSQTVVAANASDLAELVNTEAHRRGYSVPTSVVVKTAAKAAAPKSTAIVPYTPPATPSAVPKAAPAASIPTLIPSGGDNTMEIVKWSAIGLGLVVVSAGVYYLLKRGAPAMAGCDLRDFGDGEHYKTFIRSATGWESFSRARKRTVDTGLSYDEAERACERFNNARSSAQIRKGTKMEFVRE